MGAEGDWGGSLDPAATPGTQAVKTFKRWVTAPASFRKAPADQRDQRPGGAGRKQEVAWTRCQGFEASVSAMAGARMGTWEGVGRRTAVSTAEQAREAAGEGPRRWASRPQGAGPRAQPSCAAPSPAPWRLSTAAAPAAVGLSGKRAPAAA